MTSDWGESLWGDEISLEYGKALRNYDAVSGEFRVFGSNGPIGWTSQPLASGPSVVLGRKGAYRCVQYSQEPFFVIDTAYYVVPKTQLDMRWLYYAIKHYKLGEIDDGSPIPSTTRTAVYVKELQVPPLPEQKAIAHILGTLDDKIGLNRHMNATLEAMAQALFKSWFVDFDPVKAKAAGRAPEGMDADTAALFPREFVESELGPIPKGWEVYFLSELLNIAYGKNLPTTKLKESGYPVFGGNGQIGYHDFSLYEKPQVLIACRGAASGKINQSLPFSFVTNNSLVLETNKTTRVGFCFLKQFMCNSGLSGHVTGSAQPQVTIENIKNFKVLVPSVDM